MQFPRTILFGLLVIAAPLALARDDGTADRSPSATVSKRDAQTQSSGPGSAAHREDTNGALSADREQGVERARDRMSEKGHENTNGPMSSDREKSKARADQRHRQHDTRDKPEGK